MPLTSLYPVLLELKRPAQFMGLSFFGFRFISFILDLKRKKINSDFKLLDYYNYLLFFPCMLSGPIDRFDRFVSDINNEHEINYQTLYDAIYRIILGAIKKGILADTLFELSLNSININDLYHLPFLKIQLAMYFYMIVLYLDFSGYSDIAIGVSKLFGINTPENFDRPYFSRNLGEFWNRWHISLMNWLRDYIFMPLQMTLLRSGLKNTTIVLFLANFLTFFVAGVWHGDDFHYILYGICHGVAFNIYFFYKKFLTSSLTTEQMHWYNNSKLIRYFAIFITFHYFSFSLYFFTDYWRLLWIR